MRSIKKLVTKKYLHKVHWDALTNLKYGRAIQIYEHCAQKNTLSPKMLCELAILYDHRALFRKKKNLRLSDEKKALSLYNQVLKSEPNNIDALSGIARVYWHRHDREAIYFYKKLLTLYPENRKWVAYQNLANAYFAVKNYKSAEKWYLKAIRTNGQGKGHGLYYNVAKLYYFMNKKDKLDNYISEALILLERFWGKRAKSKEYFITKRLLTKMKNGTL